MRKLISDKEEEDETKASDSASQISASTSILSKKSNLAQQIEFERKRTEIEVQRKSLKPVRHVCLLRLQLVRRKLKLVS